MTNYEFTVVLKGVPEMTDDLADSLFAAGCDDGSPGSSCGVSEINFHREAESLEAAIRSAVSQVQSVGCQIERVEIEADAEVLKV